MVTDKSWFATTTCLFLLEANVEANMCRNKKFIPTRETVVESGSLRGVGKKNRKGASCT